MIVKHARIVKVSRGRMFLPEVMRVVLGVEEYDEVQMSIEPLEGGAYSVVITNPSLTNEEPMG